MPSIINASNSTGLTLTSDLSGVIQLQNNGVAMPNGGVAPAFSAYANATQTVTSNSFTKVTLAAEDFDTNSNFASDRFTPTVAGYYQLNCVLLLNGTVSTTQGIISLYKNGTAYARLFDSNPTSSLSANGFIIFNSTILVYLNGSTDYVEMFGYYNGGTSTFSGTGTSFTSRFSGCLIRGA